MTLFEAPRFEMGAVSSDMAYNIKAQAQAFGDHYPIYKYIGISPGEGELVKLVRKAFTMHNFDELDNFIRHNLVKFLYNEGKGEKVDL